MRKKLALVGVLVAATVAIGAQLARRDAAVVTPTVATKTKPKPTPEKRANLVGDERSRHSGTHRAGPLELATRNRVASMEAARTRLRKTSAVATTWVSLGPTDAPEEFNYFAVAGVDSGRPTGIVVDPRDPDVVYLATSGGGMWKTYNFLAATGPTWAPTTDTLPNLAVGAIALDTANPDTLYLGNGDFIDGSGNTISKTTDGGGSWSAPVVLAGIYPPPGVVAKVGSIRQISVDHGTIMVATDVGLFRSTDAGTTFTLVDLPNPDGKILAEELWNVAPIGGGGWIASGLASCDVGAPPPRVIGAGDPNPQFCPLGNNTAMWRTDDGVTWTPVGSLPPNGTGHTSIAVGPTGNPATTVIYAFVGDSQGFATRGFFRSTDGGRSFVDATGTLANPTLDQTPRATCVDLDVGHDQTWYNQAIVVDPTNPDHVLVGGNLCGMRTMNGMSNAPKWELVSHWLPSVYGDTANGRLPYVHADWHTATSVVINGKVRTFAGTDGGIFSSTNLFDATTTAEHVVWNHHNRGLATHLFYSVVSGDPVTGNPFVLYGGLQDNGTRFRVDPAHPSAFNQNIGGDGIGGALHVSSSGTTYWASVEFSWLFCKPAETNCAVEQPEAQNPAERHWHGVASPNGLTPGEIAERANERRQQIGEDQDPFLVHYSNVETDTTGQSVLTHTDERVFVAVPDGSGFMWRPISQDLTGGANGVGISNVVASRTTVGLYGAVGLSSFEPFYVTTRGNTQVDWTPTKPVTVGQPDTTLVSPSSIDFPPSLAAGQVAGQVFIGAFAGTQRDPNRTPPPDDKGHLYRTTDGGQTWTSIVGADPAHRLPNVPVYVVKYDPMVATTIYAGTDIGVYFTTDDAVTWNRMGDGLPMVSVRDMYVAKNQDFIRVATYGRGLWEIYPSADANHGSPGNGDYDRNLRLDWVDLAAMSSRIGVTPATTTAPLYSWIMDITGIGTDPPRQAIDTADLTALLAKFGDHP